MVQPTHIGEFDITCAQLCGLGHYRMRGALRVVADEKYRRWLRTVTSPAG